MRAPADSFRDRAEAELRAIRAECVTGRADFARMDLRVGKPLTVMTRRGPLTYPSVPVTGVTLDDGRTAFMLTVAGYRFHVVTPERAGQTQTIVPLDMVSFDEPASREVLPSGEELVRRVGLGGTYEYVGRRKVGSGTTIVRRADAASHALSHDRERSDSRPRPSSRRRSGAVRSGDPPDGDPEQPSPARYTFGSGEPQ